MKKSELTRAMRRATKIIYGYLDKNYRTPENINKGLCGAWSIEVRREIPEAQQRTNTELGYPCGIPSHTWISIDDKHYDAECLNGTTDWKQLPIYKGYFA